MMLSVRRQFAWRAVFGVLLIAASCCVQGRCGEGATPAAKGGLQPRVQTSPFGKMPDGTNVDLYTLTNAGGMEVKVITYGATLIGVKVPDRDGKFENVTLYLDSCDDYLRGHPLFGSVVGRYANRIAGARFVLDGVEYKLTANSGANHIHGGKEGFQRAVWKAETGKLPAAAKVQQIVRSVEANGHTSFRRVAQELTVALGLEGAQ